MLRNLTVVTEDFSEHNFLNLNHLGKGLGKKDLSTVFLNVFVTLMLPNDMHDNSFKNFKWFCLNVCEDVYYHPSF